MKWCFQSGVERARSEECQQIYAGDTGKWHCCSNPSGICDFSKNANELVL